MPRKPTRLKYFGVAVRRRTLFACTLFFAILAVPVVSWAILVQQTVVSKNEKYAFIVAAVLVVFAAFQGWWTITRVNPIFYRDEARVIFLAGVAWLIMATELGCVVADTVIKPVKMAYGAPLTLGGAMMIFLVFRLCLLGQHPKRGDIVRGESGPLRKKSRTLRPGEPHLPVAAVLMEEHLARSSRKLEDEPAEEENSTPTQPGA